MFFSTTNTSLHPSLFCVFFHFLIHLYVLGVVGAGCCLLDVNDLNN